jgi:hypothetical protein
MEFSHEPAPPTMPGRKTGAATFLIQWFGRNGVELKRRIQKAGAKTARLWQSDSPGKGKTMTTSRIREIASRSFVYARIFRRQRNLAERILVKPGNVILDARISDGC